MRDAMRARGDSWHATGAGKGDGDSRAHGKFQYLLFPIFLHRALAFLVMPRKYFAALRRH